ncbi:BREX system Lon protease-like protein BrxL [Bacteroides faecium]|uniref:BREX system Lon protease-like protein BrxL n=1 Tax=Bacteroides faecium TaxID=2715212 RepID=A0A6H0KNI5_9BACE|nr:BREX system Lon protease-like protein BrxL [Bacteroides faecium]QIU94942.1 BREX system Lon protease-like protein BrxL [Bacteroides faecium]
MEEKLKRYFDEMVVYKDLKESNCFKDLKLPSFLRDWLLKMFEDEDGKFDVEQMTNFVKANIPSKTEWIGIKNRIIVENERVKILTRISIDINISTQEVTFSLPDFGLPNKETIIEPNVWEDCKDELIKTKEIWGVVELGYRYPENNGKVKGKIKLLSFRNFCPYEIDLDYFKDVRKEFSVREWIDVLLGAIDYNADGYENEHQKLSMLTRLLPFVEKRLNLIELAPKGTGKSYLFGGISRFGYLSAGKMTRAKLFYDLARREEGLVFFHDYIAFDEIQKVEFDNPNEMTQTLQGYMEQGTVKIGDKNDVADAGFVMLGNINEEKMDEYQNMFSSLPTIFRTSALMDRIHGFIKGWDIPRMNEGLKISGWALNSEYFSTIMHLLRDDVSYRATVDRIVEYPDNADTRDTEAIKRITTAFLKLLFPHVRSPKDINAHEFNQYCLIPAKKMRQIIVKQMGMIDTQYKGKNVPSFSIREYEE